MIRQMIARAGTTLAWFLPMGTDSSVSRAKNQFAPVDAFPEAFPPVDVTETSQAAWRTEPSFVRMECANVCEPKWFKAPKPVPVNRAQRRDRNFGVTTDRHGNPRLPKPEYVAFQPKRLDRVK